MAGFWYLVNGRDVAKGVGGEVGGIVGVGAGPALGKVGEAVTIRICGGCLGGGRVRADAKAVEAFPDVAEGVGIGIDERSRAWRGQRPEARVERMIRGRMVLSGFWGVDSGFVERSLGDAVADDEIFRLGRVGEEFSFAGGVDSFPPFVGGD